MSTIESLLPVFDPVTKKFQIYKKRSQIHKDGDWHRGIQAYIVRQNEFGEIEVLIQKRSANVDISGEKYDQSLATQMIKEDNLDEYVCLRRGLKSELGLELSSHRHIKLFEHCDLRITKKYNNYPNILNREFLSLYLIDAGDSPIVPDRRKILETKWVKWSKMYNQQKRRPNRFTKTSRFYLFDHILRDQISLALRSFFSEPSSPDKFKKFPIKVHYFSDDNIPYDISLYSYGKNNNELAIYDVKEGFKLKEIKEGEFESFEKNIESIYSVAFKNSLS